MIARTVVLLLLTIATGPRVLASQAGPVRIVTLSAAITETVFALGRGGDVVGVPSGVIFPTEAARRVPVGAARQLGAEGILAQRPTLILADSMLAPALRRQLGHAGVRIELVSGAETTEGAMARIQQLGRLLDRRVAADSLAMGLRRRLAGVAPLAPAPRVLFVYARGAGTLMVSGSRTSAAEMLRLAGATNAVQGFEGFRPLTAEAVVAARPDIVLLPSRGLASLGGVEAVLKLPGMALTPAGRARRVVALDDTLLLGFGPRLADAVEQLVQLLERPAP
ncbi:MAG: ABC transporter substrate-binding protein [Gemmatimonadales bacterium]|nr:ABC transporter substrate-binding protein [Gemmatimonadales bacterium]